MRKMSLFIVFSIILSLFTSCTSNQTFNELTQNIPAIEQQQSSISIPSDTNNEEPVQAEQKEKASIETNNSSVAKQQKPIVIKKKPNIKKYSEPIPQKSVNNYSTSTPSVSVQNEVEKKEVTVYITRTGSKYHSAGCRYLSRSCIPINLSDAKDNKYTPCSVCNPQE